MDSHESDTLDNTVAFLPENSDWPKRTWDLYVVEGDGLVYVDTFERLLALLGPADPAAQLRLMVSQPVWQAAPPAVKEGAYAFLLGVGGGHPVAGTQEFLELIEKAPARAESAEDLAQRLDPDGRHVVAWSMEHEDADGRVTVRCLWLLKVAGTGVPVQVVLDLDPEAFDGLAVFEDEGA